MDVNFGFGRVLRVRFLAASAARRRTHIFAGPDETVAAMRARGAEAHMWLELRRQKRVAGDLAGIDDIEARVRALGYRWQDEDAEDCRYSYWRSR